MIYVVAWELIPEAHAGKRSDSATNRVMIGFAIMMTLDVALG
ncbi:GufA protein [Haloplasma contractile]|uniref:GufA protein n=1 Tax=Haloplasma contractile SSD-17B TaxID=1033810 RepID=U2FD04_9MOLU|nr:GufA protein [Haloplasma contractile]ERJ10895.1 GufA protein [Haloplasma contractile SSD-17B]